MIIPRDKITWSSYPNNVDKRRDEIDMDSRERQVLGAILRKVLGWGLPKESDRPTKRWRWSWWCSPGYVSKETGIPYSTVKRIFDRLVARHIITYEKRFWEKRKSQNAWVTINQNVEEWTL